MSPQPKLRRLRTLPAPPPKPAGMTEADVDALRGRRYAIDAFLHVRYEVDGSDLGPDQYFVRDGVLRQLLWQPGTAEDHDERTIDYEAWNGDTSHFPTRYLKATEGDPIPAATVDELAAAWAETILDDALDNDWHFSQPVRVTEIPADRDPS